MEVEIEYTSFDENIAANGGAGDWCGVNPFDPDYRDDPYPKLSELRELNPVNLTPVNTWRISRFEDVNNVLRQAKTSQTLSNGVSPSFNPLDDRGSFREFMLNKDGEEHARLRQLVVRSLNMKTVRKMEDSVQTTVTEIMDKALADGGLDLIKDMAMVIPSRMVCTILGIPEEDRIMFDELTAKRTNGFFGRFLPPDVQKSTAEAGNQMADYFEDLVAKRQKIPADDLISELLASAKEDDQISFEDLVVQAIGVCIAGFETTIGLIGNGGRALLENPSQLQLFRENPDRVNAVIEEALRYDTPVHFIWRTLEEAFDVGGKLLPKDAVLWLQLAAANHDPRRFSAPDTFNIMREKNANISFGGGPHFCLGNQLARMEGRHALQQLSERTQKLTITPGEIVWSPSFFRVMGHYPISFS